MDLEGNLILDRRPARRWVSAIAVMIPVVACVAGVTWFVRAFISPPTVAIPGPMMLSAAVPATPSALPARAEPPSPKPESVWPAAMMPSAPAVSSAALSYSPPAAATVGAAPPAGNPFPPPQPTRMAAAPSAFDPVPEIPPPAASPAIQAPTMPIIGRVPMPRPRPPESALAAMHAALPTPRPRPTEEETAAASTATANPILRAEPAYDRHPAE
jgi:hypothetical protein